MFLLPLILLVGCTNNVEENKYSYLDYKDKLQKQESFSTDDDIDFNVYFNINRENEEIINYGVVIDNPSIDMYNVKALLIHDYVQEDAYPSVGILDDTVELKKDSEDKITLSGKIQTDEDISNVNFKLYLEYTDLDGLLNKIYYKLSRG